MKEIIKRGLKALRIKRRPTYQAKYRGHEERWKLICPWLPNEPTWMLDVGSNLGETARRAASLGHYVLGVEIDATLVSRCARNVVPNAAFMLAPVDELFLKHMPRFPVIFLLSVFHRIWALRGKVAAESTLRHLIRSSDVLIIESSSKHKRYLGQEDVTPPFQSDVIESAVDWHLELVGSLAGDEFEVKHLGNVPCTAGEPLRPLFAVRRVKLNPNFFV